MTALLESKIAGATKVKRAAVRSRRMRATTFVLPAFVLHALIVSVPALSLLYYSFTQWDGIGATTFVGFANFQRMIFEDADFHASLLHNLVYVAFFLTIPIIFGLLMALLTVRAGRMQLVYRAIFFLPYVVSPVISGKIFAIYYDPFVGISAFFKAIGFTLLGDVQYLSPNPTTILSVAFVDFWHWWGFVMVIMIAALHQVDKGLYEAASLDGAGVLQQFFHVTLPQLRPTIVTLMMVTVVSGFVTFDYIWIMTQGGPAGATEIASTWIFKQAFNFFQAGYASSLSLTVCLGAVVVYLGFSFLQRKGWDV